MDDCNDIRRRDHQYLARSFKSSLPSRFLSNIFICRKERDQNGYSVSDEKTSAALASAHHGVSVNLQLLGGDGLPVLQEEVLQEALKTHVQ